MTHRNPRRTREGENLTARQKVYFDVAWRGYLIRNGVPDQQMSLRLSYADGDLEGLSERPISEFSQRLMIEVSGWRDFRDVVPASKEFVLAVDGYGVLSLTPVNRSEQTATVPSHPAV